MDEFHDLDNTLWIRTPSNKMEGVFVLYQTGASEVESRLVVARQANDDSFAGSLSVRIEAKHEINTKLSVMYRAYDHLESFMLIVASSYLDSFIEIRPNNRMFGSFELLPPPKAEKTIISTEDATTRSRPELTTINYGDSKRMMVGQSNGESLESFIKFGNLNVHFEKLAYLEKANLRLYYAEGMSDNVNIELHLPNVRWSEYGVTHANKPVSMGLATKNYTINKAERYIEFDIMSTLNKWLNRDLENHGLIITSNENHGISFNTRESTLQPVLDVKYITNEVSSVGRAEVVSTMFVWGTGNGEIKGTLEVHSDWGYDEQMLSHFYVHRPEVPLLEDIDSVLIVTKPDQHMAMTILRRDNDDTFVGHFGVWGHSGLDGEVKAQLTVTRPDLYSWLTVDPNISLESKIYVRIVAEPDNENQLHSFLSVTREDVTGRLTVKEKETLDVTLTVVQNIEDTVDSYFAITRPEIAGNLITRAIGHSEIEAIIDVPAYDFLNSLIAVKRESIEGFLTIRKVWGEDGLEAFVEVPNYNEVDSYFAVTREEISAYLHLGRLFATDDLHAMIDVPAYDYINSFLSVTREEVEGYLTVGRMFATSDISAILDIPTYDYLDSAIAVSRPEIHGHLTLGRLAGSDDAHSFIDIPTNEHLDSFLTVTREEIEGFLTLGRVWVDDDVDTLIWVKEKEYIDSYLTVHNISEMYSFIDVIQNTELPSNIAVSRREINGYLHPRVIGETDLLSQYMIRQRDATDLNSFLHVGGSWGAYYYIL